ncbi:MAG: KH domain-containing protein [Oscillatoriales cyanobacterium RM2_1_1]|nr:KH domain-containing protein [Oscillatoriales cyanobacterium SM2_3_0]NJO45861.1 KH domain-containing protein [Oscillatoriales cyanobacterium RM2_1_1]
MSLNNSNPEQSLKAPKKLLSSPDYAQLTQFLIEPFLESPDALRVDCESTANPKKNWIRLAFEAEDKGRVYGRGGRNIQAVRSVLSAFAELAGEFVHLDIYEEHNEDERSVASSPRSTPSRRPSRPQPASASGQLASQNGDE